MFPEFFGKSLDGGVTGFFCDLADGHSSGPEKFQSMLHTDFVDIVKQGHPHSLVKTAAQIIGMHTGHRGEFIQGHFPVVMQINILKQFDGSGHNGLVGGIHQDPQEGNQQQP